MTGRNERCWCGSGKKYKKCHLDRDQQKRLPPRAYVEHVRKEWSIKKCMHPLAGPGVCNALISAHTVQRSQTLEALVDEANHVMSFKPFQFNDKGELRVHRLGWRDASTFGGFCGKHDHETFAPIEMRPVVPTAEQAFLLGYRALCYELRQKQSAAKVLPKMKQLIDRGLPPDEQRMAQDFVNAQGEGVAMALKEGGAIKAKMDMALLAGDWDQWASASIEFTGPLTIAATGGIIPNYLPDRTPIQMLHDKAVRNEWLFVSVVATDTGGAVVYTWDRADAKTTRYVESVLQLPSRMLPSWIVQFLFFHIENTYFAPDWWRSLPVDERIRLMRLAEIKNPYYEAGDFTGEVSVPWSITGVTRR